MESGPLTATELVCSRLASRVTQSHSTVTIFTGQDNEDKTAPCVITWAEAATEDFPFSGIWHVRTHIIVKDIAADSTVSQSNALYGDVYSMFLTGSIEIDLTSQSLDTYFAYQVVYEGSSQNVEQDAWVGEIVLDVVSTTKAS